MNQVPESERITRKRRIDPRLTSAGWTVQPFARSMPGSPPAASAVEEWPTTEGPADYALCASGKVQGVVEAKRLSVGTGGVLTQAERYSRAIAQVPRYQGEYGVPFLYSTNGDAIRFHDVRRERNRSRVVSGFHTPSAFAEMLERDADDELARLARIPMNDRLRPYQCEANQETEKIIRDGYRKMLVTMATGTGKTLTEVNQTYRLINSGVARRVLFLVDRRALAAQAARAFSSFEAEPGLKFDKLYPVYTQPMQRGDSDDAAWNPRVISPSQLEDPRHGDAFVYICTIQRLAKQLSGRSLGGDDEDGEDAARLNIPIHAFDLIIADECHRGYSAQQASVWRETLDYFDAIKIGLTATPAAHTVAYFERIAYSYDYERAVQEGYLVDYEAVRLRSGVRMKGVFLHEGEQIDEVDPVTGIRVLDILEDERSFDATDIEKKITVPESNRKILEEIKRYADEHEATYGRFPKTLIFAAGDQPHVSHADQLVEQAQAIFNRGEGFVRKITGRTDRPLRAIREFRNRPAPGIAVSVDLMSTGVDIPDLEFIVLLRPVKSRILFEQMLGRGTRRGEQHPDKSHFVLFDCFDGTLLKYFRQATGITAQAPATSSKSLALIIDDIWQGRQRDYNIRCLVKRLQRIDKEISGAGRDALVRFIPRGDVGTFARNLPDALASDFDETMTLLRDSEFQQALLHYPRPREPFIVATTATDEVDSEWLIRVGANQEYRPEDYLQAFSDYVRDHRDDIDALQVLLERGSGWSPATLRSLRAALKEAPGNFTEANLRRAFKATKLTDAADIISMVKRAAAAEAPLLSAEERVNRAVAAVTQGRALTDEQARWMEYIRQHLIVNLSIDAEDFDVVPVLSDRGGWGRAVRVFKGGLDTLMADLNRELAAA